MSSLKRLAVFGLISSKYIQSIRLEQHFLSGLTKNNIAFNFPVHVTLKGRFLAYDKNVEKIFHRIYFNCSSLLIPSQAIVNLSNPKYIKPQLSWLEVLPDNQGFNSLMNIHQILEAEVKEFVVEDEVPKAHKNLGFRPHVTLGWGVTPQAWEEYSVSRVFSLKQAQVSHIALACYPQDWTANESVDILLKIPIQ